MMLTVSLLHRIMDVLIMQLVISVVKDSGEEIAKPAIENAMLSAGV